MSEVVPHCRQGAASDSSVEAMFQLFNNGALDVNIENFGLDQLMKCVGKHCESLAKSCTNLRHIIMKLRTMGVTLENHDDFAAAVQWISEGYEEPPDPKVVKKYANALKSFLRMHHAMIPDNPILTGTVPQWMFRGDEVDVFYQPKDTHGVWWHAVIIDDLPKSAKSCCVYWVGWEQCNTGNAAKSRLPGLYLNNPTVVNRDNVRSHIPGKCSAGSSSLHSVDWVKANMLVVHIDGKNCDDSSDGQVETKVSALSAVEDSSPREQPSRRSKKLPELNSSTPETRSKSKLVARRSTGGKAPRLSTRSLVAPTGKQPDDDGKTKTRSRRHNDDEDEEDEEEEDDDDGNEMEEDVAELAADAPRFRENSDIIALGKLGLSSLPKATAVLEHFYWSQSHWTLEECISTLESLSTNPGDHSEFDDGYRVAVEHLRGRCTAFARLYGNTAFNELCQGAVTALDDYKGRESVQARKLVEDHLRRYAFIITPRMWSKYEICLIMCILLDSSLVYQAINQKTGLPSTETYQNR